MMENDLEKRVRCYIKENNMLEAGDSLAIGVSGGADSMCLLFMLYKLKDEFDLHIRVVHVEHGIRGEESKQDALFVKEACDKLGVPVRIIEIDAQGLARENGMTVEEAGREARYEAFYEEDTDRIAVAHHANDAAETLLFNLFRGSGIRGAGSIAPVNGKIIRPLLCLNRAEIEEYDCENGIIYHTDRTNDDNSITRNSVRNEIIPKAVAINEKAVEHMCEAAESMREAEDFIAHTAVRFHEKYVSADKENGRIIMDLSIFNAADPLIIRYVIRMLIKDMAGRLKDVSRVHVQEIMSLKDKSSGKQVDIAYGITAAREFNSIVLCRKADAAETDIQIGLKIGEEITLPDGSIIYADMEDEKMTDIPNLPYTKWIDYDKIKNTVVLRTRRSGDQVSIKGGTKKLKDVMIDDRIPKSLRDSMLIFADGFNVVWIPGYRIGEYYKVTGSTEKILKLRMEILK